MVSQRVHPGMVMYHAQEKIINTPGSEITGNWSPGSSRTEAGGPPDKIRQVACGGKD